MWRALNFFVLQVMVYMRARGLCGVSRALCWTYLCHVVMCSLVAGVMEGDRLHITALRGAQQLTRVVK